MSALLFNDDNITNNIEHARRVKKNQPVDYCYSHYCCILLTSRRLLLLLRLLKKRKTFRLAYFNFFSGLSFFRLLFWPP